MKWRLVFGLFLVLAACSDLNRPDQLRQLDDLEKELNTQQEVLDKMSKDELQTVYFNVLNITVRVEGMSNDTLQLKTALALDRLKRAGDEVLFVALERDTLLKLIPECRASLEDLRKDIEKGSGQRHKYDEFIRYEHKKIKNLAKSVEECTAKWQEIRDCYDEVYEVMLAELDERFKDVLVMDREE